MNLKVVEGTTCSLPEKSPTPGGEGLEAYKVQGGTFKDVIIEEGCMFLLPGTLYCTAYSLDAIARGHAGAGRCLSGAKGAWVETGDGSRRR